MDETQQEPIRLKTPMHVLPEARTVMQQHGCLIGDGSVTLPAGSTRTLREQYLQTITLWYDIVLPDQFRMLEAYDQHQELSILYVPPEGS